MSSQCNGQTSFMNVAQRCTEDAYDHEGYCKTHLVLILRQSIAELEAELADRDATIKALREAAIKVLNREERIDSLAALLEGKQ